MPKREKFYHSLDSRLIALLQEGEEPAFVKLERILAAHFRSTGALPDDFVLRGETRGGHWSESKAKRDAIG